MQPSSVPLHAARARLRSRAPVPLAAVVVAFVAAFLAAALFSTPAHAQGAPDSAQNVSGCYALADQRTLPDGSFDQQDTLVQINVVNGQGSVIGLTGTLNAEGMSFGPNVGPDPGLYAVEAGKLGTFNRTTGVFTPYADALDKTGPLRPQISPNPPLDVDGLAYSPSRDVFFASVRRMLNNAPDLLFAIDPATGLIKRDYFGAGVDYMIVQPLGILGELLTDIDDLALNPVDDRLYAAMNSGGSGGELVRIDPDLQTATALVQFRYPNPYPTDPPLAGQIIDDIEGLSFFNNGQLYASTGGNSADLKDKNRLFEVDPATGLGTLVAPFPTGYRDFEALACLSAEAFVALRVLTNGPGRAPDDADTPPGPEIVEGQTVTWTYEIVNTGFLPLSNVSLTDSVLGTLSCPPAGTIIGVGESYTCRATGTAQLGQYANSATVTASAETGTISDTDASHYYGIPVPGSGPGIELTMLTNGLDANESSGPGVPRVRVGSTVTWTYVITNTGDEPLGALILHDDRLGDLSPSASCLPAGTVLQPDATVTCTRTGTAQLGLYAAVATVTGTVPGSSPSVQVQHTDLSHYIGQEEPVVQIQYIFLPIVEDQ